MLLTQRIHYTHNIPRVTLNIKSIRRAEGFKQKDNAKINTTANVRKKVSLRL